MTYGILIPCYNHGQFLASVIDNLKPIQLPIFLIDDGSEQETYDVVDKLAKQPDIYAKHLAKNQGKGGAVIEGIQWMAELGFTHAIQVDADGQHDLTVLPDMLAKSQTAPEHLISGYPVYGASVPKSRLYGRYATHISVWVETLSTKIKDSMIGLRVYPIKPCIALFASQNIGRRMDFDIDVLVRLYWQGVEVDFLPVGVHYPDDGVSHFSAFKDNVRISWLHTRLIFGMLPRAPMLIRRHLKDTGYCFGKSPTESDTHWSRQREKGTIKGIKLLLRVYELLGSRVFSIVLHFPIIFYFLFDAQIRQSSRKFQRLVASRLQGSKPASTYQHLYTFGLAMLDKLSAWRGDITDESVVVHHPEAVRKALDDQRGCLLIGSHLGNLELCRALSKRYTNLKINALVFTANAKKFNDVMAEVNQNSALNLIQVDSLGPETAIMLQQKMEEGEWVVIVGDRTSVTQESKVEWVPFLGEPAPFPIGPFVLASLLKHPTYSMFGFLVDGKVNVYFEPLSFRALSRAHRSEDLQHNINLYAQRLEDYALKYPLHWFNFYDFWTLKNEK